MIYYNKPDLNAPRFRKGRHNVLNKSLFENFKKQYPSYANISYEEFKEIIQTYSKTFAENVITHREGVELPEYLGSLFIGSCHKNNSKENMDYKKSSIYNVRVTNKNYESDSFIAKLFYTNYQEKYRFKYRNLWDFTGYRNFTRSISENYRREWKKYIQIDRHKHVWEIFKKVNSEKKVTKLIEQRLETYNEFEGIIEL